MYEKILNHINFYAKLNSQETEFFKNHVHIEQFKKNELIFTQGKVSSIIYFLVKGCVRLYYDIDGVDKTAFFYTEGKFICAGESYTFDTPSQENFQALEESILICFEKNDIEKLLNFSPKFELIARIATEDELITCQRIIASFVTKTPEERYIELLKNNSSLFLRVPQHYIASFLGITPEALSRIKTRYLKRIS